MDAARFECAYCHSRMGNRGDLLALVDGAPGQLATLQGALTSWTHRELAAIVHRRAVDQAGGPVAGLAPVVALRDEAPWDGPPDPGTDMPDTAGTPDTSGIADAPGVDAADGPGVDDPEPDAGAGAVWPPRRDAPDDGPETLTSWYVAVALPDRWRVVGRGHLAVSDGRRSWAGTSTLVTERDSTRAAIHDAGLIGACLYPGALLGGLELASPEVAEIDGRSCWLVDARPRPDVSGTSLASSAAPHALRLHRDLVGVEHRMWFDTGTGILLRHEGYVDGRLCSSTALSDLVFDAPLADDEFRPPPGAVVRARHELLRDHLSEMGIDPDTVDLDDPAQVRDALRQGG
jgi:hypothetical protein